MNELTFNLLSFLDFHRGSVSSFFSFNLALLQQHDNRQDGDTSSSVTSKDSNRLLNIGTGFRSYYDGNEAQNKLNASFMLVWESDDWTQA